MTKPVVLGTVMVVVLLVEAPVSVAAAAGIEAMVAPTAMPGPAIGVPTAKPDVDVTWTLELPLVVVAPLMKLPPAPSVRAEPVAVAFVLSTKAVPLVTDKTVAPAGMPTPYTAMPGNRPAVLVTVTFGVLIVVAPAASAIELGETCVCAPVNERLSEARPPPKTVSRLVTVRSARRLSAVLVAVAALLSVSRPLAVRTCAVASAVAATLSTKVVALVTEATVAPTGIFGPEIGWPATRPVVLATVTVVEAFVVETAVRRTALAAMAETVTPAGIPVPETPMPVSTPIVPPEVRVTAPAAVAGWFKVTLRPEMAVITDPATMPVPVIGIPTTRPVASATTTVAEPATVVAPGRKTAGTTTLVEPLVVEAEPTLNAPELKM